MQFLKKLRDEKGLTQYAMAKYLGILQQTYIHYEREAKGIRLEVLGDIREKLGLTWEELGKLIDEERRSDKKKAKKASQNAAS